MAAEEEKREDIARENIARWSKRIRAAFTIFDKDDKNSVVPEEVGSIMRYLGYFPSEKEIAEILLPEMMDDQVLEEVPYNKFEKKMLEVMSTGEYEPDVYDATLMHAFEVIDTEKKGWLSAEYLKELLTTKGSMPFRPTEIDAFLQTAKDPESGRIYYEDYVHLLRNIAESVRGEGK
eukprot:g14.t1